MKLSLTLNFIVTVLILYAQPAEFSWYSNNAARNYITSVKDQGEQGPCGIFAAKNQCEEVNAYKKDKTL